MRVFEKREGWVWAQLQADGYVGYLAQEALTSDLSASTHCVAARPYHRIGAEGRAAVPAATGAAGACAPPGAGRKPRPPSIGSAAAAIRDSTNCRRFTSAA